MSKKNKSFLSGILAFVLLFTTVFSSVYAANNGGIGALFRNDDSTSGSGISVEPTAYSGGDITWNVSDSAFETFINSNGGTSGAIQNSAINADYNGLKLDTTNGKIAVNTAQSQTQFNAGTKILIPVDGPCEVTVVTTYNGAAVKVDAKSGTTSDSKTYKFDYVYGAGEIELTADSTTYLVSIATVHNNNQPQNKETWAEKTFGFKLDGKDVTVNCGAAQDAGATVTFADGEVVYTQGLTAYIRAQLAGKTLDASLITNITGASNPVINGNNVTFDLDDANTIPKQFELTVKDGTEATPTADDTAKEYVLGDGSVMPNAQGVEFDALSTDDKIITIDKGTGNKFKVHSDNRYGYVVTKGNTVSVKVAGDAVITFKLSQYAQAGITLVPTATKGGTFDKASIDMKVDTDMSTAAVAYTGEADTITFTVTGDVAGVNYIPSITVKNIKKQVEFVETVYSFLPDEGVVASGESIQSAAKRIDGIFTIDATANGAKVQAHGSAYGSAVNAGTKFMLNLPGNADITVESSYEGSTGGKIGLYTETGTLIKEFDNLKGSKFFNYTGGAGTVYVLFSDAQTYVKSIKVTPVTAVPDDGNYPEPGSTLNYDFTTKGFNYTDKNDADITQGGKSFESIDGFLKLNAGAGKDIAYNGGHGLQLNNGNTLTVKVSGDADIRLGLCQYANGGTITANASAGKITPDSMTDKVQAGTQCGEGVFTYKGAEAILTFTFATSGFAYLHFVIVEHASTSSSSVIDVYDFGAEKLVNPMYNNVLTEDIMNSWYAAGTVAGTTGQTVAAFNVKDIAYTGNNDRIRSSNKNLIRYDNGKAPATVDGMNLTGYLYANGTGNTKYLTVDAKKNDVMYLYLTSNGTTPTIEFDSPSGKNESYQTDANGDVLRLVAKESGKYKIWASADKLVLWRMLKETPVKAKVSGSVTAPAELSNPYKIAFTNRDTKEVTEAEINGGNYQANLLTDFTYDISLIDAEGFVIETAREITFGINEIAKTMDIAIVQVPMSTITGTISGLSADELAKVKLAATPTTEQVYIPKFDINTADGTFTIKPASGIEYNISAEGVNDYFIKEGTTLKADADGTFNVVFEAKPVYPVTVNISGLDDATKAKAGFKFTNLNEEGYVYSFNAGLTPELRDGTYSVDYFGLGGHPVKMNLTPNVVVNGAAASSDVSFSELSGWDFASLNNSINVEEVDGTTSTNGYAGLLLNGSVAKNKTYLLANSGATIKVPAKNGQKVTVTYCYSSAFYFNGDSANVIGGKSGSTSTFESAEFTCPDDSGYVTITQTTWTSEDGSKTANQTYFGSITVSTPIAYQAELNVGADSEYKTINEALAVAASMNRPNGERITINIEPGNYEEMLVINVPNVTLKNSSASPSIELTNKGIDIVDGAVRITSYYGHGYSYYSMGPDCKWNAEQLAVNKTNGGLSFSNPGSGTTSGSYWNATVVVYADGFQADDIIFENSFNQYISKKESEDIIVEEAGTRGTRPTAYGDTSVQNKSFVERAAALALVGDKAVFDNCRFVGRQDTLYGQTNKRVFFNECAVMGGTDYIFGGMIAVFNKCKLVFNTSYDKNDVGYITSAQQDAAPGYLMNNCTVTSSTPGVDTANKHYAQAGYLGRPWKGKTSETVFLNTIVKTTNTVIGSDKNITQSDKPVSLITPAGWSSSLGGEAPAFEYNTLELSGEDNSASRIEWSTVLDEAAAADYTVDRFMKGADNWNPVTEFGFDTTPSTEPLPDPEPYNPTLYLVGDSTVCNYGEDANYRVPRNGYGMKLDNYLEDINIVNYAVSGRSTKDFLTEGTAKANYEKLLTDIKKGDFLLIGFGHNDEKPEHADRYSDPNGSITDVGSFKYNLYNNFIKPAQDKGAIPVLATPIVRRNYGADAKINSTGKHITADKTVNGVEYKGGDYSKAIRELGAELGITVIDNTAMTEDYYNQIGKEDSAALHAEYTDKHMISNGYVNSDGTLNEEKRVDNTHLNAYGADVVAYNIANAVKASNSRLKDFVKASISMPNKPEPAPDPSVKTTLWMVGDSTVCNYGDDPSYRVPRNGYGMKLNNYLNENVTIENLAVSGRSSLDFPTNDLSKDNYTKLINEMKDGDFLLIGFGHNDEKPEYADRYSDPNGAVSDAGSFKYNLYNNFIKPAQDKGVTPILATPIVRRSFDADGNISASGKHVTADKTVNGVNYKGGDYAKAIKELGAELGIVVIDNTTLTENYYEQIGKEESAVLHAEYNDKGMTDKGYVNSDGTFNEEKRVDNTHLNAYGADVVAYFLADALKASTSALRVYVKDGIVMPDKPGTDPVEATGDVDGDGAVTANDAAIIVQFVSDPASVPADVKVTENGDMNSDSTIDSKDAALILKKALEAA